MNKAVYHIIKSIAGLILTFNILMLLWVVLYAYFPVPTTKLMVIEGKEKEVRYKWVDLDEINGSIQLAVMCAEDQQFLLHNGLDFQSIQDAMESNKSGGKVRGASTITQQVVKNVFLWPNRDWLRKGAELYFALLVEMVWSKERIMEVYLNVAEMGDGIFGVEAASSHYFKKSAVDLTSSQAATLAALLPSPKRYANVMDGAYIKRRSQWILGQMNQWGGKMTYDKSFVQEMIN